MTRRTREAPVGVDESLTALAEHLLETKSIALANDALLMQLIWILLAKGLLTKPEVIAAIDLSAATNRRAATPDGHGAAIYLEQIRARLQANDAGGLARQ